MTERATRHHQYRGEIKAIIKKGYTYDDEKGLSGQVPYPVIRLSWLSAMIEFQYRNIRSEGNQLERFADELDLAQYRIEQVAELAIAEVRKRSRHGTGRKYCIDCGDEIPVRRRAHVPNATRCVCCQERQER